MRHRPLPVAAASFNENATGTVYTVTATDPDAGASLSYSLGGADKDLFNINAGVVTFKNPPNFEAPADADANNVYNITVIASDGSLTGTKDVAITVDNVNDAPTVANAIPDQIFVVGGAVDTFAFSANAFADQDSGTTLTYGATLAGGAALPAWLSFNPATRTFSGNPPADGEISITVTASDGSGGSVSDTFKLKTVTAPTVQSFAVTDATTANGATLGKVGEALTFTVTLSEAVTSTGALTATVNLNGTTVTATCAQVTAATNTLLFTGVTIPQGNNGSTITLTDITVAG